MQNGFSQRMEPIRYVFPLFLFNQMLSAFLRNDKNPGLATLGVYYYTNDRGSCEIHIF